MPFYYQEVAPEDVEKGGSDLSEHWHPCDSHTVKESLFEVKHHLKNGAGQTHHDVRISVFDDARVLAHSRKYLLREAQYNDEGDQDDYVDHATSVQIHST